MIVVLCHPEDAAALWLRHELGSLGIGGIELVSVDELVFSRRIVHRMDSLGDAGSIELAGGRALRAQAIAGLVNRVRYLPTQHFAAADPQDRAYATEELGAFAIAWLDAIAGRVINPPMPGDLGGGAFDRTTLIHLAAMAGLPTGAWRVGTKDGRDDLLPGPMPSHAVIVFDGRLFGPLLPRDLQDGCRRLATLLGVPLLEVLFQRTHDGWRFVGASGAADFRIGGRPFALAVARAFSTEAAAG